MENEYTFINFTTKIKHKFSSLIFLHLDFQINQINLVVVSFYAHPKLFVKYAVGFVILFKNKECSCLFLFWKKRFPSLIIRNLLGK